MSSPLNVSVGIRFRRDIQANWTARNPILMLGEPAFEMDTGRFKIGDGVNRYNTLAYFAPATISPGAAAGVTDEALLAHINSKNPHPVYDDGDGPSLLLLYRNAKV